MGYRYLFIVDTDPWIECPIDRVEDLDPDKSTVVLGYKWQLPRTNMKNVTVSPSNYDENYLFPVGKHRVMWTATLSGREISCTFFITVIGEITEFYDSLSENNEYLTQLMNSPGQQTLRIT